MERSLDELKIKESETEKSKSNSFAELQKDARHTKGMCEGSKVSIYRFFL